MPRRSAVGRSGLSAVKNLGNLAIKRQFHFKNFRGTSNHLNKKLEVKTGYILASALSLFSSQGINKNEPAKYKTKK